jgi:hypothetical protein
MARDRAEAENLVEKKAARAKRMADLLEKAVRAGRSRPGPKEENDVAVDIWKTPSGRPEFLR